MPINLDRKSLSFALISTLAFVLAAPVLLPHWRLMFFAPFLIILYYQRSYLTCLWGALLCGLVIDLLSSDMRIGLHSVDYCLTTWLLYGQRRHFFADSLSTLPIMTILFSITATVIQVVIVHIFEQPLVVSWQWVLTDLVYMPLFDACYAFAWFVLPSVCFGRRPRRGRDYFQDA